MGYRLEFTNPNRPEQIIHSCGGKLFGYIENDILEKCKSWNWLKEHGFFCEIISKYEDGKQIEIREYNEVYSYCWDYGVDHKMFLSKEQFKEFITLYIEDRNTYWASGWSDSLENYSDALDLDVIECAWL